MNAINGDSSTPKRRKLTDFFPEVPASEGPQQFPRGLRQSTNGCATAPSSPEAFGWEATKSITI